MIRVLIVEDSATQRDIFRRLIAGDGRLTVVAEAANGREAVAMVRQYAPDVVLMDIQMPDMDGIAATRQIMREHPVAVVVASATLRDREVGLAMKAYEAGAVMVIEKPEGAVLLHLAEIGPTLRAELIAASAARCLAPANASRARHGSLPAAGLSRPRRLRVIGMCASTGGPPVLLKVLSLLRKPFPVPVLLVQHISRGFEQGFAKWLSESSGQSVRIATHGQKLEPGVWLAPGGQHLVLGSAARLHLAAGHAADIHCPSGNPLFVSLGEHAGPEAAGVVLTGMGDDGAAGLLSLKEAGGITVAQDETSSLIWGMPKAAHEKGAADYLLSPGDIARALEQMTGA